MSLPLKIKTFFSDVCTIQIRYAMNAGEKSIWNILYNCLYFQAAMNTLLFQNADYIVGHGLYI